MGGSPGRGQKAVPGTSKTSRHRLVPVRHWPAMHPIRSLGAIVLQSLLWRSECRFRS